MKYVIGWAMLIGVIGAVAPGAGHAEQISPRRLLEVMELGNPVVSPDGTRVAFRTLQTSIERNTYDSIWYVQDLGATSKPLRVADGGIPLREYATGLVLPEPAVWSADGYWIYFRALVDGRVAVWRAATDGSLSEPVAHDPADIRKFSIGDDGRTLKYSVGATREQVIDAEQAEYDRGVHVDENVFIGAGLFRSSQLAGRLATQRFVDDWFRTGPLLADAPERWKAVDLGTMAERELSGSEVPAPEPTTADLFKNRPEPWKWERNPDDGRIAVLTRVGEQGGLQAKPDVELSMLPGKGADRPVTCRAELCAGKNIMDIQWRPDSDDVLFTVADRQAGRAQSIFRWNVASGEVQLVVHGRGLLRGSSQRSHDIPCGLSAAVLVCVTAEAGRPPRLEAIDQATGQRRVLFDPNAALAVDIAATVPARLVRWKDSSGREVTGWLFAASRKEGAAPPPLFVNFYTCDGFLRGGGMGDEWPAISMAEQGISALCINGNPAHFDVEKYYGQGLEAVETVVDLLASQGEIDRSRVGMAGLSYGSEATMWAVIHSDLISAASITSPSVTPNWYLFNSLRENFRKTAKSNWQLGLPEETPEQWKAVSPAFNLDKIKAPLLFQMSEQEYMVALEYVIPLINRHQGDLYIFPDEPHIKFQPKHKLAAFERNLDWFRFWLQGHEDPDTAKAAQYKHWREMRKQHCAQLADKGDSLLLYCAKR